MALKNNFKSEIIGTVLVVKFSGDVNCLARGEFENFIEKNSNRFSDLVFNFIEVTYLSSFSMSYLVKRFSNTDVRVVIVSPRENLVYTVFSLLCVDKIFNIASSMEEAFQTLGQNFSKRKEEKRIYDNSKSWNYCKTLD